MSETGRVQTVVECSHLFPCTPTYRCAMHRTGRTPSRSQTSGGAETPPGSGPRGDAAPVPAREGATPVPAPVAGAGRTEESYTLALERLVKAVESHKDAGWPPCPECDEALVQARSALIGLRFATDMRAIEDAEQSAARMMPKGLIR